MGKLMVSRKADPEFSPEETARRRDEVVRRMAMTPPEHKVTPRRPGKKKQAGAGRGKGRVPGKT
jgi:hypothetical protein